VSVTTTISSDSVTVGQRLQVKYTVQYPDSLVRLPLEGLAAGNCRLLGVSWLDHRPETGRNETATINLMTLDLETAEFPGARLRFLSPAGDTLSVQADGVSVPVRSIASVPAGAAPGENLKPLKEPWEAPADYRWLYITLAVVAAAGGLLYWWLRRRRRRMLVPEPIPVLPPDYIALQELVRVEGLGLLNRGEFKTYYTLVTDAVRRYLEGRFRIEAMDRTTAEVLDDLERARKPVEGLEALLQEADLVKFAKLVPGITAGQEAMKTARDIVTRTAQQAVSDLLPGVGEEEKAHPAPAGR
jgi:hypothetical protein